MLLQFLNAAVILSLIFLSTGCVLGTTPVEIIPRILDARDESVEQTRDGDILVRPFVDNRATDQLEYIGAKRNGYHRIMGHLSVVEGTTLPELITGYIADALEVAGYRTRIEGFTNSIAPEGFRPIATLEGGIEQFWYDSYFGALHHVELSVRLVSDTGAVIWEGLYEGRKAGVVWLELAAEYAGVIRPALDKALAQAIDEFSSDEFDEQLRLSASESGEAVADGIEASQTMMGASDLGDDSESAGDAR